ncbi:MAG TPA: serine/threonine-protein kinase, partial [Gemmataceae bacterium]|nr:serine/threonine-protein kinase [Gemmataceae bacterium]
PLGQTVAIKVLPPSKAKDHRIFRRFQREARLALKLVHPNVVRSFHVGSSNGLHYLVMEHLEGETLDEVLERRGKLAPTEAVRLIHQALTGLQHVHEQGLVHRDMKPGNLMLVPGRVAGQPDTTLLSSVKILDIGLARANRGDSMHDPGLTSEGTLLGTPNYMAPEQARDPRRSDIRADIYSVGCALYHTLTGQPPFPDTNIVNQMIRHATQTARPLKELNPAVPEGLQQIVSRMLAKDPAQRYATPGRAAQALEVFLTAGSEPTAAQQDPKLSKYLTWVEAEGNGKAKAVAPTKAPAAVHGTSRPRKHKRHRPKTAMSLPAQPPPAQAFDVELVPVPAPAPALAPTVVPPLPRRSGLNRRDFAAFAIGAGSVLLAILVGWAVARLAR